MMTHATGSADSARPVSEKLKNMVESAGIPVRPNRQGPQRFPAQEQAAARSRNNMISLSSMEAAEDTASQFGQHPSKADPNGSWTGVPADLTETPVQDADDL